MLESFNCRYYYIQSYALVRGLLYLLLQYCKKKPHKTTKNLFYIKVLHFVFIL